LAAAAAAAEAVLVRFNRAIKIYNNTPRKYREYATCSGGSPRHRVYDCSIIIIII